MSVFCFCSHSDFYVCHAGTGISDVGFRVEGAKIISIGLGRVFMRDAGYLSDFHSKDSQDIRVLQRDSSKPIGSEKDST